MEKQKRLYSDVVIVGAGLSGIDMACQLQRQLCVSDYVIYDRARELGGAWAANKCAQWVEASGTWHVYLCNLNTEEEFLHEAKVLISAVGGYTNPKLPALPGLEKFEGSVVHTAKWNKEYDLRGLKVAVVGNGCSGSQVVPAVIDEVSSLTQFIRVIVSLQRACSIDPDSVRFYNNSKGDKSREESASRSQKYITENAPERYRPLLTPGYDLGCRRRILDNHYTRSLRSPRMKLVKDSISQVHSKSVVTGSGDKYPVDFIILATGFEFTQWKADSVIGRRGKSMKQLWDDRGGIGAYKTVAMNEFPNMFYLLGPNSGSGHTSVLFAIECSVNLAIRISRPILQRQASIVEQNGVDAQLFQYRGSYVSGEEEAQFPVYEKYPTNRVDREAAWLSPLQAHVGPLKQNLPTPL
ncbi:hypothetical protein N7471_013517 [Penicillium samsonianum]|uniref:uncharacterized protein n=1 Tax=Penicillium samsonianum TaxID=1882272 RepID=UPI0025498308|nr:uncharacterized protein N7471_013517 [Penicillium samsonianum]KAJ6118897.1 hypothetical protein N7471_013517 [Penicillium samsonianum]